MSDDDSIDEAIGTFRATMAAHGRTLEAPKPKRKRAKLSERDDGALWTNVLNGVEYRFNRKTNKWVATGRRGIGMLD